MSELRGWSIYAWVALPTVMYGGYALLGLLTKKPIDFRSPDDPIIRWPDS
jgi:hypothetical protein